MLYIYISFNVTGDSPTLGDKKMYNKILNDIAKSNIQERLQVVKYDHLNNYFIATNGHILICESNKRFKNKEEAFFCPVTGQIIDYSSEYPDFTRLFSENKQDIVSFTNGAIYKKTSKNRNIAKELIRFGDITFDLKYITQVYSCLGIGGGWSLHGNAYCYTTQKGLAFVMPVRADEKHLNENYIFIKTVDVSELIKKQTVQTCFVLYDDYKSVIKCFKDRKNAVDYINALKLNHPNTEYTIEEVALI